MTLEGHNYISDEGGRMRVLRRSGYSEWESPNNLLMAMAGAEPARGVGHNPYMP